jgi:hypothetical protein
MVNPESNLSIPERITTDAPAGLDSADLDHALMRHRDRPHRKQQTKADAEVSCRTVRHAGIPLLGMACYAFPVYAFLFEPQQNSRDRTFPHNIFIAVQPLDASLTQ